MAEIRWEQFGLRKNPYDSSPLLEGGDINVGNAFVGREEKRQYIDDVRKLSL